MSASDPLGSVVMDGAPSVDLGKGILWLFGDSFVALGSSHRRDDSYMRRYLNWLRSIDGFHALLLPRAGSSSAKLHSRGGAVLALAPPRHSQRCEDWPWHSQQWRRLLRRRHAASEPRLRVDRRCVFGRQLRLRVARTASLLDSPREHAVAGNVALTVLHRGHTARKRLSERKT